MKCFLRRLFYGFLRLVGSEIRDERTGRSLGRAVLLPWRGKIYVLGAHCELWVPVPRPQNTMCFWKQAVGFTTHAGAFPARQSPATEILARSPWRNLPPHVCLVVLDHRKPTVVEAGLQRWTRHGFAADDIFLVFGGAADDFAHIPWAQKHFLDEPRLRTRNHQREKQSYRSAMAVVSAAIKDRDFTHVLFVEYDQWPVAGDVAGAYLQALQRLGADVVGYEVRRMDGTIHPHWLGEDCAGSGYPFAPAWSMLGTGHFWKREAWDAVAAENKNAHWYLELDLPTTARDLGFVLGRLIEQEPFVRDTPENLHFTPATAQQAGAWTIHPIK
jgi:hypothetical protein